MEHITKISGINNMSIFYYQNQKYYFFGDFHNQNNHSCDDVYHNCDYFNYTFTDINTYDSACTTIGPLLYYWLNYNNHYQVTTHVLIEESYTHKKDKKKSYYNKVDKIISKRDNMLTTTTSFPIQDMSWLELTSYLLQPCFGNNTCPFSPYIKVQAVDIRAIDGKRASPFSLHFLVNDLKLHNVSVVKKELNIIINTLLSHTWDIFEAFMDVYGYHRFITIIDNLINKLKVFKKVYIDQLKIIKTLTVVENNITMHPIARIMSKLPPWFAADIKQFILNSLSQTLDEFIPLNIEEIKSWDDIANVVSHYMDLFTLLSAYLMDTYVLCKLFNINKQEIIIYTGACHIELYNLYFKQFAKPIFISNTFMNQKCISIPKVLNLDKYREYYYKDKI